MHLCIVYIDHEAFSKSEIKMHDHVMRYHMNTSCQLAYLLSFNLMVGKRKFRLVVLYSLRQRKQKRTVTNLRQVMLGT